MTSNEGPLHRHAFAEFFDQKNASPTSRCAVVRKERAAEVHERQFHEHEALRREHMSQVERVERDYGVTGGQEAAAVARPEVGLAVLGLASGFLKPLESTSIHRATSGVYNLVDHFPDKSFTQSAIDSYNAELSDEIERIRDCIILHHCAVDRSASSASPLVG
jgi:Tryptophan halogenase